MRFWRVAGAPVQEEYKQYVSAPLGIDFTSLPDDKSVEVARLIGPRCRLGLRHAKFVPPCRDGRLALPEL